MPGAEGDYYQRLETAMTALETMRGRSRQVSERRTGAAAADRRRGADVRAVRRAGGQPIDAQIAGYQARIDQLLVQYTEKHPEVVALRHDRASAGRESKVRTSRRRWRPADGGATTSEQS